MRILVFMENDHAGGMDTFIAHCIISWPSGDEFVLVCNDDHPGLPLLAARLGARCVVVPHALLTRERLIRRAATSPPVVRHALRAILSASQYLLFLYHIVAVRRLIAVQRPDRVMIVAGNYPGGGTPRAAAFFGFAQPRRKPLFVYHNDPSSVRWFLLLPEFLIDWCVRQSVTAFVTVSYATERGLAVRPALRHCRNSAVIYNGIPFGGAPGRGGGRRDVRAELGIAPSAPILLMLGTYEPRKGHEFLLRAFESVKREIPDAVLVVAGDGYPHDRNRVRDAVAQAGLERSVRLLGFERNVDDFFRIASVLVVPSQHSESFGLTIVEAMRHRVPVVATRVGGIPEVLQDGVGGYVVPNDAVAFARAVLLLLNDATLRRRIGELGYETARQRFDATRMARAYHDLVKNVG